MADEDKYVVYHGIEDGAATFSLYDDGGIVRRMTMAPEEVPTGTEVQDHFWVEIEDDEITEIEFDAEFTAKKNEEYQDAVDIFKQLQEQEKQRLNEDE